MVEQEIEIMTRLKEQFLEGLVVKKTVIKARDIYNKYSEDNISYCMCSSVQRRIYAKTFIDWYEAYNR
jgi:hypothetical protein